MSYVDRLRYLNYLKVRAREQPEYLMVPMNRVMAVADDIKAKQGPMDPSLTAEKIVQWMIDGKVKMFGVPIRVVVHDPRH